MLEDDLGIKDALKNFILDRIFELVPLLIVLKGM